MLEKLLKKETDQFQFMNNEYEYITTGPGTENEFLKSVTFRFVRVQDGLPITGNTNISRSRLMQKAGFHGWQSRIINWKNWK